MFGLKGFHVSASGAIQGHHGCLVLLYFAVDRAGTPDSISSIGSAGQRQGGQITPQLPPQSTPQAPPQGTPQAPSQQPQQPKQPQQSGSASTSAAKFNHSLLD